ncbi:MAG: ribonucleoside triphosphate reductase [Christensenellaceae bacterium]|jgi:ribonucleoside-triphosphate reductase|nr:ribonucleoside triphosphate reductase [Christensenellaceae bacterium]
MIKQVLKRDGTTQEYNKKKIADAIFKAAVACDGQDRDKAEDLAAQVEQILNSTYSGKTPTVEQVQDVVEKVLIENRHARVAKAYILYREKRTMARESNALIGATIGLFSNYLNNDDWVIKENANQGYSIGGLNNYVREAFTKNYWLNEVYPVEVREAHTSGIIHLHDLGFFGPYCAGWDLRQLLTDGFGGVPRKVTSKPAKHLRSFLGQIVNATFTLQGEAAGAQAWSNFDTYCAPFIRFDNMTYKQVKQCLQEFIFNINVPTRVGFQCPFSNVTLNITCPKTLKDQPVVIGGNMMDTNYGDYQVEMDIFNKAFCEVILEGDSSGRVFTFPIPTINVTKDFDWNSEVVNSIMDITCKYGIPYFANYVNSDLSPDDAVSMCCRLRLDVSELRKRGGGLFGSNPLTGSIGVVTLNLPRIGYLADSEEEYFALVDKYCDVAKSSLEIKRKIVEKQTRNGLYPYSKFYLRGVKERTGNYWSNHFNTIGIVGMNESLLNFMGKDITTEEGQAFAVKVMEHMRDKMKEYQKQTGNQYNLEATPAEGVAPRFAKIDKKRFPEIITAGKEEVCYTNSTQVPVGFSNDIFKVIKLQDTLQSLYTGGTVLHLYLGEKIEDKETAKKLLQKIFLQTKMPYISITPTFSVCEEHGYIAGEHFECPKCGREAEVWSRVVGYLRPVQDYNESKFDEYMTRQKFRINEDDA